MAAEPTIICPNCATEIKLTESLAAPLVQSVRQDYESRLAASEAEMSKREAAVREARKTIDIEVNERLNSERKSIAEKEAQKAKLAVSTDMDEKTRELKELREILMQRDKKLEAAQKAQAEMIRRERDLEDQKREIDLTVEKKVQSTVAEVREKARLEAEEGLKMRVAERDQQISSMTKQIEELKRKAEQGSQQLQGEVLELELESTLAARFPQDNIEPVPKGEFGGDVLQKVSGPGGQACGSILWESKRTKNFSEGWLPKLRNDQRTAKAEIAVLVTHAMPRDVESFDLVDGVWITRPRYAMGLVIALRQSLVEVANSRASQEGQETKMELVYQYLTGPKFRHRVEAIVEKFNDMQADLDRERKSMTRLWAKRDAQIQGVIESTVGLYGDLQGIAGGAIKEIEGLELPLLDVDGDPDTSR